MAGLRKPRGQEIDRSGTPEKPFLSDIKVEPQKHGRPTLTRTVAEHFSIGQGFKCFGGQGRCKAIG